MTGADPWSSWTGSSSTAAPTVPTTRALEGPIEAKFKAHEQQMDAMRSEMQKIAKTQDQHQHEVAEQFKQAAIREEQNMKTVETNMEGVRQALDRAVTQSFALQTQRMDEKFAELKHLFVNQKRPAEAATHMES